MDTSHITVKAHVENLGSAKIEDKLVGTSNRVLSELRQLLGEMMEELQCPVPTIWSESKGISSNPLSQVTETMLKCSDLIKEIGAVFRKEVVDKL